MYVDRTDTFSWTAYLQSLSQNDEIMTLHSKNVPSLNPPDQIFVVGTGNLVTNSQG